MILLLALALAQAEPPPTPAPGHWPHLLGPEYDGASRETGLLKEWPPEGPPLLWRVRGLGDGIPPVSVAGGLIFVLGFMNDQEFATALDGDGKVVWRQPVGSSTGEKPMMRFLNQRTIAADLDRLYAFTSPGRLACLSAEDGRALWAVDYVKDLEGRGAMTIWNDTPVVEGPHLLCSPGGAKGVVVALDKLTGKVAWRSDSIQGQTENLGVVPATIGGVRQVLLLRMKSLHGLEAATGRPLWSADWRGKTALNDPPIVREDTVFVAAGYGVGSQAYRIRKEGELFATEPLFEVQRFGSIAFNLVRVGDHVYTTERDLRGVDLRTGKLGGGLRVTGMLASADGSIVVRTQKGEVLLVEADPAEPRERARFRIPSEAHRDGHYSMPVIAGGRLYLRLLDELFCYDLRTPEYRGAESPWKIAGRRRVAPPDPALGKGPDAAFVPTPADVVKRMLAEAGVKPGERVLDLGSGDGRVLIAAAKDFQAKARGIENDRRLVELSRERIKSAGVDAEVVEGDLFQAELGDADVVAVYLGEDNLGRLLSKLGGLKAGARIVSHAHRLGASGPIPDRTVKLTSSETGREHEIHVWTLPFKR